MSIEFIMLWFLAGVVLDVFAMWFLCVCENSRAKRFYRDLCERDGVPWSADDNTYTVADMALETPWWAHLIMILAWPTALLRIAM